jgi:hypothetical protein
MARKKTSSSSPERVLVVAAPDCFVLPHKKPGSYSVPQPGVLQNDYPTAGRSAEPASPAATAGTVALNADGGFSFTPPTSQFTGTATFDYRVRHISGAVSGYVTVTLKIVNAPPEASPDCYLFVGGSTSYSVPANNGVLANDYDPQGKNPLGTMLSAVEGSSMSSFGTTVLNGDGSFMYIPATPANPQDDSFRYQAKDSADVLSDEVTVTIRFI